MGLITGAISVFAGHIHDAAGIWGLEKIKSMVNSGVNLNAVNEKGETANFWAYFADEKLAQWGQAGDWSNESKRIYEVRFGVQEKF